MIAEEGGPEISTQLLTRSTTYLMPGQPALQRGCLSKEGLIAGHLDTITNKEKSHLLFLK